MFLWENWKYRWREERCISLPLLQLMSLVKAWNKREQTFSKSRQKEVCSNESYFPLSTVYSFLYLVFKHSPCHQHRGFYGWVLRLQEPESTRKILLTSQLIFVCQLQIYGISINWDFNHWLAYTDILSSLLTHADLNLEREVYNTLVLSSHI